MVAAHRFGRGDEGLAIDSAANGVGEELVFAPFVEETLDDTEVYAEAPLERARGADARCAEHDEAARRDGTPRTFSRFVIHDAAVRHVARAAGGVACRPLVLAGASGCGGARSRSSPRSRAVAGRRCAHHTITRSGRG